MIPLLEQQELMASFIENHDQAAIFADPGLGKTRAALEAFKRLRDDCGVSSMLVVAPLRVARMTWPAEVKKWTNYRCVNMRDPGAEDRWDDGSADIYVINTEYLQQFCAKYLKGRRRKQVPVDMLVLDEIGMFRNHASKRARALREYRRFFTRFVGLTGTPSPNNYQDLFGQIRMLDDGERFSNYFHEWRKEHFTSDFLGLTWKIRRGAAEKIETAIADMAIVLRGQDWLDIPPVNYEDVPVVLPTPLMRDYRTLEKELILLLRDNTAVVASSAGVLVNKLRQFIGGAVYTTEDEVRSTNHIHDMKVEALKKLHSKIEHAPMLVGVQYQHEADRILKEIPWARAFDERDLDRWNAGEIQMWVANPKSMKYGLNCQGFCCNVAWFTLPYSFDEYQQFNARVARTGQKNPVTIWRIMADNTIDWSVEEVLRNKEEGQNTLLKNILELNQG